MPDVEVNISGVPVTFPFQPYDVQVQFMSRVIECLEERRHGVLESPTGTGKTLSLLCSTLAWLQQKKVKTRNAAMETCSEGAEPLGWVGPGQSGKIIYASRTHSQLRQVIRQFNNSAYRHVFRPTVIGSRDHMCINSLVKKETSLSHKNMRCSLLVKQKQCRYFQAVKNSCNSGVGQLDVMKELSRPDQAKICCPYYLAREAVPTSDIVFMPYNYLIDLQMHKNFKFNLSDSIIIIDEGHNVAKVCEESSSVSLTSANIASCISDISDEMQQYYDSSLMGDFDEREYSPDDLVFLQQKLHSLEKWFSDLRLTDAGIVHRGSYIFEIFSHCEINDDNRTRFTELLTAVGESITNRSSAGGFTNKGLTLKRLADIVELIYSTIENNSLDKIDSSFKVFLEKDNFDYKARNTKSNRVILHYWCFNPAFLLNKLQNYKLRSIIITSGTLSPLHAVVEELGFSNAVTLSSKHIVQPFQVMLCTLGKGPSNYELKCTYSNREDEKYWRELGMTIVNLSRHIPHGLLVFFPSYTTMKKAHEMWSSSGVLSQLSSVKSVFMEPNNKDEMEDVLSNYSLAVDNNSNGAILFGVCRGKISEGLDFSGKYARGVIVTGIPYAPPKDKRVQLKKEFIDINKSMFKDLTGDIWYQIDAMRAINQAVGRAIRHSADYGVIILCDSRFHQSTACNKRLPSWLLPHLVPCPSFGFSIQKIKGFFKSVDSNKHLLELAAVDIPKDAIMNQDDDKFLNLPVTSFSGSFLQDSTPSSSTSSSTTSIAPSASQSFSSQTQERLKHISLFNRAVVDTEITAQTELEVKPAKKRKIRITPSNHEALEQMRRSQVKSFILDVKLTLDEHSYATFAFIVKKYNHTNDFEETLNSLKTLFLSNDVGCEDLFRGCHRIFSEPHRERFQTCLRDIFNT